MNKPYTEYKELKEDIQKIWEFVQCEFNPEDINQVKSMKEGLTLEKIDTLDIMLNDYNKQVKAIKRKELQKQAQARFKKAGVNLKLEEYEIYEIDAKSKNLNMSQYVKKALESLITPKSDKVDKVGAEIVLDSLTVKYEALENTNKSLNSAIITEKQKTLKLEKNTEIMKTNQTTLKAKSEELEKLLKAEKEKNQELEDLTFWDMVKTRLFR